MILRDQNLEVIQAEGVDVRLDQTAIDAVKDRAKRSPRRRARICTHPSPDAAVHEMVIALASGCYIRPHRHVGKSESYLLIEGQIDLVVFDEAGTVQELIRLGDSASGLPFFYRHAGTSYHTVVVRGDVAVFHETTNGPFAPSESLFALWAPDETNLPEVTAFLSRFRSQ